jgi:hypothetical protein
LAFLGLIGLALFGFYSLGLPILVLMTRKRVGELEAQIWLLQHDLAAVRRLLEGGRAVAPAAPAEPAPAPVPASVPAADFAPAPFAPASTPYEPREPAPAAEAIAAETTIPGAPEARDASPFSPPSLAAAQPPREAIARELAGPAWPPVPSAPAVDEPTLAAAEPAAPDLAGGEPAAAEGRATPPPMPPPSAAAPPADVPPPVDAGPHWTDLRRFNWESLVGVKLFSAIAGVALLLAGVFFLRFSLDHGWLQPPVRVAIGVIVGLALLGLCELKVARHYRVTANALDAAAIGILFATFFAAHSLWQLIPAAVTFLLLVIVTTVAVLLSIRRESLFIAVLGLLGGFAAPALLSTGQNNPFGLFGYLLLLNAGLAWVARVRRWPLITALTLVLTTIYQWGWVMKFASAADLPLAAGIFLVFPLVSMFTIAMGGRFAHARRSSSANAEGAAGAEGAESAEDEDEGGDGGASQTRGKIRMPRFGETSGTGAVLPLLLATYVAAVPQYGARYGILFGFLLCIDVGLFAVSLARRSAALHLTGAATTLVVFAIWLGLSYGGAAWPAVLGIVAVFALLYLFAPVAAARLSRPLDGPGAWAIYAAPLLLAAFPVLVAIEPAIATPWLLFGALALLLIVIAGFAIVYGAAPVYFVAATLAIFTEALWSARYLTASRVHAGLLIYFAFTLIYVAVPLVARRFQRELRPRGASLVPVLGALLLAFFLNGPDVIGSHVIGVNVAHVSLWGLAGLVALALTVITVESAAARQPWMAPLAVALSWFLLGAWWAAASDAAIVLQGLLVVAALALLTIGVSVWMRRRVPETGPEQVSQIDANLALSLTGHLFLAGVLASPPLATPPWPALGVLFALTLALTVTTLYLRRAVLHVAGVVASAGVLLVWAASIDAAPWPLAAIGSALALLVYALATLRLSSRAGDDGTRLFAIAAVGAAIVGELIAIVAGASGAAPGYGLLAAAHVIWIVTLMTLGVRHGWSRLVYVPLLLATVAVAQWSSTHGGAESWGAQILFAGAIYVCFLAYPLALGRRVHADIEPYRAAVFASVPFFFLAHEALLDGGFASVIGALPVAQALLMLVLLARLLRLEPPGARALGRLALVAGAALAFVTVAIPLQLEKEWLTVAWALEAAAVAWLYRRIAHRGLLVTSAALLAVVFLRLAINPEVFVHAPRGNARIINWYLYTYVTAAACYFAAARLLARTDDRLRPGWPRVSAILPAAGVALLFLLLNIEIADYYSTGATLTFRFSATLAQDLTYTLGWGIFALALLAVGIRGRNRPARMASIALLLITVLKCFLHDLGRLGGLYLVASFVGLAVCLALVALALQRFALAQPKDAA